MAISAHVPHVEQGHKPNAVRLQLLSSKDDHAHWQSEDAAILGNDDAVKTVVVLVLGGTRRLQLRDLAGDQRHRTLMLEHGTLVAMHGLVQRHYQHRVPPETQQHFVGPTTILTWLRIKRHSAINRCPAIVLDLAAEMPPISDATPQGADGTLMAPTSGTLMAMPAAAVSRLLVPADPQDERAQIAQASLNSLLDAQSKHDRWAPSRERIDAALQTRHLRRVAEDLDGNCQFSALPRFVFKDPALHNVIRQAIVEIIELAHNHYGCYLAGESPVSYCERMRKEGEWGDALTLQAFCDFAGVQAILITDLPEFSEVTVSPLHSFDRSALHELASAMGFLTLLAHLSARISAVPPQLTLAYFSGWHYDSVVSASEAVSCAPSDGCHALDHPAEDALSIAPPQPGPARESVRISVHLVPRAHGRPARPVGLR